MDNAGNWKKKKGFTLHLNPEDFEPASASEKEQLSQQRESVTFWQDAFRRFRKNKVAMFAFVIIVLVALFAFIGPMISPYTYEQQIRGHERLAPCAEHWFGTDSLGRDMLVRVMIGTRVSLIIGIVASFIELIIGSVYGAISGYIGGWVDNVMMRIAEIVYSIPETLVIILLSIVLKEPLNALFEKGMFSGLAALGPSLISIFITFALIYWVNMARMVRGQMLALKQAEYVTAARAMGAKGRRIIFKHLLPNSAGTIIITTMFQIPQAIFTESFLSFIGLGVSKPMASLGSLASDALQGLTSYPYLLIFPAVMISIIILSLNLFGDGLRDALDPRLRA